MRYVRLAKGGKNPIEKLRNGGHELEEVQNYPDLGVLIPEPFVVLDFDTKSDAEIMLKIVEGEGLKTRIMETDNGYHFWFKSKNIMKNFVKRPLACGLVADCTSRVKPLSWLPMKKNMLFTVIVLSTFQMGK